MATICGKGKNIAILTSGGDSQGMNAAVRAAVRMGISVGCKVYGIRWGYQGLVDGGDNIFELTWNSVDGIMHLGGTFIGSARCNDFRTPEGRRIAAYNMISKDITNLIVIGGDGSLTGAETFKKEWKSHFETLLNEGKIDKLCEFKSLNIVGIVGSIDNDFCGTDMTIGADSALHRITECVESIKTTAQSHQRAFVLEVMGRNSGYLGLIASIACGADAVFIPEYPPSKNWGEELVKSLNKTKQRGKNYAIIIVAEGAQDNEGVPISSDQIKEIISKQLKFDTRVTVLGHVQRGGTPSSYDRILATRFGLEAVIALLNSSPVEPSYVVCIENGSIVLKPMMECVEKLNMIKLAYKNNDFDQVTSLRGGAFKRNVDLFNLLRNVQTKENSIERRETRIGVLHCGPSASGSNSIVKALTRSMISSGYQVIGFENGFEGLIKNKYVEMTWSMVEQWNSLPGCILGASRTLPNQNIEAIVKNLKELNIGALAICGGFEGILAVKNLSEFCDKYPEISIPCVLIPATMSNNIPGNYQAIGCDTALNVVCNACDNLITCGTSYRNRIYVVETMGQKCGFLPIMAAISGAADCVYIYEEKHKIEDMLVTVELLKTRFQESSYKFSLIIASDGLENYDVDFMSKLFNEEIPNIRALTVKLGHLQQGNNPSPYDSFSGAKFGLKVANYIKEMLETENVSFDKKYTMLAFDSNGYSYKPIKEIYDLSDTINRKPKDEIYMVHKQIVNVLSGRKFRYVSEAYPGLIIQN